MYSWERIWGERGQRRLEQARVCVLTASATGTECLKNLVLPGIGAFTVVDGAASSVRDLGENFFVSLEAAKAGINRGECAASLLQEMNSAVEGGFISEGIEDIQNDQDLTQFFAKFSVVVATQIPYGDTLRRVADACWETNVPLIIARSYGLYGFMRIIVRDLCVEQSREEREPDLRLTKPFAELERFAELFNLEELEGTELGHVPFVVILMKAIKEWRQGHDDRLPSGRDEKEAFKRLIESWRKKGDEENFDEALKNSRSVFSSVTEIPLPVQKVFELCGCNREFSMESEPQFNRGFQLLVRGLRAFVEQEGQGKLPLRGNLPDMTTSTESYVGLQRIYKAKADADAALVYSHVCRIAAETGMDAADEDVVRDFCRNAAYLRHANYRSLADELSSHPSKSMNHVGGLEEGLQFYALLRAADRFRLEHGRFPGEIPLGIPKGFPGQVIEVMESDTAQLHNFVNLVLGEIGLPSGFVKEDDIVEMTRYGGTELHSVASLLGGVAAQEAVKLICRQFVPIDNAFVYNGLRCTTVSFTV